MSFLPSALAPNQPPNFVGTFPLHTRQDPAQLAVTQVTIQFTHQGQSVFFKGTRLYFDGESQLSLQIPTVEQWKQEISWLDKPQQERITNGAFHDRIRQTLLDRLGLPTN